MIRIGLPAVVCTSLLLTACGMDAAVAVMPAPLGGDTTVQDETREAFARPARNLTGKERSAFQVGDSFFNRNWVTAPASTTGRDGLGPLFNARSCSGCHFKDGRGRSPAKPGGPMDSMLVRLSVPGSDAHGGPRPEPRYGGQLQDGAIRGVPVEGRAAMRYVEREGTYGDGSNYSLRVPSLELVDLAYGLASRSVLTSPRVAPQVIGLGLLAAVPEEQLLAHADPDDKDGDGISGRPNRVWDHEKRAKALGRFGWKANQPTLRQQVAAAFLGDMGITSPVFQDENFTAVQAAAAKAPNGGRPEIERHEFERVVFYVHALAVPAQRARTEAVVRGAALFERARCDACHLPLLESGRSEQSPALSNQTFRPYTDLLLHDMGPDLADGRPDFEATGSEWRTPPLWGLGLVETVNGHNELLHDGRARGFAEAILWHGGEAQASREAFRKMPKADRDALIAFLRSL